MNYEKKYKQVMKRLESIEVKSDYECSSDEIQYFICPSDLERVAKEILEKFGLKPKNESLTSSE